MHSSSHQSRGSRQQYKAALIPVLALALAAVVFWPAPADPAASGSLSPQPAATTRTALSASAAVPSAMGKTVWPQLELAAITAINPFARPPAIQRLFEKPASTPAAITPAPVPADTPLPTATAAASVASAPAVEPPPVDSVKLQAILASGGERMALIDSRIVRAGETLPSGYRIVDITRTGLVMEFVAADGPPQPPVTRSLP